MALSRSAQIYVLAVVVGGLAAIAQSTLDLVTRPADAGWLLLAALTLVSGSANVKVPAASATISVSETFVFTSVLLFGPSAGTITVALDAVVVSFWLKRQNRSEFYRLLFNIAAPAISIWIAAHSFFALAGTPPLSQYSGSVRIVDILLPLLGFTLLYFLLNSWLVAFVVALKDGVSAYALWRDNLLWLSLNYFGGASVAALLVGYRAVFDVALLLIIAPILLVLHFTFRSVLGRVEDANKHLARVNKLYLSTIETLATAIDAKDQVTHGHIRRVQYYATALAAGMGIKDELQVRAIEAAALLHDMGKLAVPDYILNKPGPLTTVEFSKMKRHAEIGAEILASIDFPYPVVPIVRHHHENWDGTGYPDGLKGTEIPIGARILSVVDCFDALTSDRPYRLKLSDQEALKILGERRGTMYDPLIVDTFTQRYDELARELERIERSDIRLDLVAIAESAFRTRSPAVRTPALVTPPFEDLGLAGLVADVAPALMGCTLAVFRRDEATDVLRVVSAYGPNAAQFRSASRTLTDRVVGWVAANATSIQNADARLDSFGANDFGTCTAIPILSGDAAVGVVTVYTPPGRTLSAHELDQLETLARHNKLTVSAAPS